MALGCAGSGGGGAHFEPSREATCRSMDSIFALSGWRQPMELSGRVKLDVKQYRVQGRFRAAFAGNGDFTFEFSGNMVMGGHHEDVVVSFQGGKLYVLDRERGRLYEGEEADELIREGLGTDWRMVELIRRITAWPPPCDRVSGAEIERRGDGGARVKGRVAGESFRAEFAGRRIEEASWPVAAGEPSEDRLNLEYRWRLDAGERGSLEELVAFLEGRRWRMILQAD